MFLFLYSFLTSLLFFVRITSFWFMIETHLCVFTPLMLLFWLSNGLFIQVKFHVISRQRLQSCSGTSISSMHHLNMEQLAKTLTTLYNIYDVNRKPDYIYENEAEFRSLYVLLHLNTSSGVMVVSLLPLFFYSLACHIFHLHKHYDFDLQGEPLSLWFRKLTSNLIKSKEMCFVRKLLR